MRSFGHGYVWNVDYGYSLKKYDEEITIDNYKELGEIDGIGKGSLDRVKEILENKKLSELE